ncbi:hypothetical protein ACPXAU_24430, partial [Salmonella enterica]|uniref:hypothetical protein n=1 Tax=Salmonella enterica TaxID=28901 RepID=UPI003CF1EF2E
LAAVGNVMDAIDLHGSLLEGFVFAFELVTVVTILTRLAQGQRAAGAGRSSRAGLLMWIKRAATLSTW